MSCARPLIRAETHEKYRNQKGDWSYKAEFLPRGDTWKHEKDWELMVGPTKRYRKLTLIGCGQCIECRLQKSREWATRIMLEKKEWPENECWFITLTYNDENIKFKQTVNTETGEIYTGATLCKEDLQKFWRSIRDNQRYKREVAKKEKNIALPDFKMKYLNAGEYGKQTQRPHYHAIVYGLKVDPNLLELWKRNERGEPVWRCKELEAFWKKGNVIVGRVTWESAAYVARYSLKKAYGNDKTYDIMQGRLPEYITMSQGIGKKYFQEHLKDIYESDTVPIINKKTGQLVKPPKAFDRMLKEIDEDLYNTIKRKRQQAGEAMTFYKLENTDKTLEEYRQQTAELQKMKFKDMRRKEI